MTRSESGGRCSPGLQEASLCPARCRRPHRTKQTPESQPQLQSHDSYVCTIERPRTGSGLGAGFGAFGVPLNPGCRLFPAAFCIGAQGAPDLTQAMDPALHWLCGTMPVRPSRPLCAPKDPAAERGLLKSQVSRCHVPRHAGSPLHSYCIPSSLQKPQINGCSSFAYDRPARPTPIRFGGGVGGLGGLCIRALFSSLEGEPYSASC